MPSLGVTESDLRTLSSTQARRPSRRHSFTLASRRASRPRTGALRRRQPRARQPPAQRWAPAVSGSQALGRRLCQYRCACAAHRSRVRNRIEFERVATSNGARQSAPASAVRVARVSAREPAGGNQLARYVVCAPMQEGSMRASRVHASRAEGRVPCGKADEPPRWEARGATPRSCIRSRASIGCPREPLAAAGLSSRRASAHVGGGQG